MLLFPKVVQKKPDHNCLKSIAHGRFEATTTSQVVDMLKNDTQESYYAHDFSHEVSFTPINTLSDHEFLECLEIIQAPGKRGKRSQPLTELSKTLKENADLIVMCMDVIEAQEMGTNQAMKKRMGKLRGRKVLIVIADAAIMYESIDDIREVVERVEGTLGEWSKDEEWHVHAYVDYEHLVKQVETLFWGKAEEHVSTTSANAKQIQEQIESIFEQQVKIKREIGMHQKNHAFLYNSLLFAVGLTLYLAQRVFASSFNFTGSQAHTHSHGHTHSHSHHDHHHHSPSGYGTSFDMILNLQHSVTLKTDALFHSLEDTLGLSTFIFLIFTSLLSCLLGFLLSQNTATVRVLAQNLISKDAQGKRAWMEEVRVFLLGYMGKVNK
ncbi:hypothetical protein FGO68_gene2191 [Halteria grandinella]|uniref:Uncharacterized protein n=1 Tax=Halteria grandinella TaxID=5974 RepID=A0A8J8T2C2_HALGN|nr:hypothetical protein FGO68_gene2191 [Halteria grandinella]